jgi:hypothetical protein
VVFASDYNNTYFKAGAVMTLTASFSDGTTSTANLTIPGGSAGMALSYNGKVRDRVGQGVAALASDGQMDGVFTASFPTGSGSRTVTSLRLSQTNGVWNTVASAGNWVLGAAANADGAFYNAGNGSVNFTVGDGGSFVVFASDYNNNTYFKAGAVMTLTISFSDGTTSTAIRTL